MMAKCSAGSTNSSCVTQRKRSWTNCKPLLTPAHCRCSRGRPNPKRLWATPVRCWRWVCCDSVHACASHTPTHADQLKDAVRAVEAKEVVVVTGPEGCGIPTFLKQLAHTVKDGGVHAGDIYFVDLYVRRAVRRPFASLICLSSVLVAQRWAGRQSRPQPSRHRRRHVPSV